MKYWSEQFCYELGPACDKNEQTRLGPLLIRLVLNRPRANAVAKRARLIKSQVERMSIFAWGSDEYSREIELYMNAHHLLKYIARMKFRFLPYINHPTLGGTFEGVYINEVLVVFR